MNSQKQLQPATLVYVDTEYMPILDGVYSAVVTGNQVKANFVGLEVSIGDLYVKGIDVPCDIHVSNNEYSVDLNVKRYKDLAPVLLGPDDFIGTTSFTDLSSSTGSWGTVRLAVRIKHTISGPMTDYVVLKNSEVWHETNQLGEIIEAFNNFFTKV